MSEIKSGLLDMETRSRRVPQPRHPKREIEQPPAPVEAAAAAPTAKPPAPAKRISKLPKPALRGAMAYLDADSDAFLKACQAAGEVSSSAVIRLALAELADRCTPEDVARMLLLGEHPAHRNPGRKRND